MIGLLGMAYYSAPNVIEEELQEEREEFRGQYECLESVSSDDELLIHDDISLTPLEENQSNQDLVDNEATIMAMDGLTEESTSQSHIICFGKKWSRRSLGILSAMCAGTYGGSVMVPMKWAPADAKGMHYLISFAIGAATVNFSLWIILGLYLSHTKGSFLAGYQALPSLHLDKMWWYGGTCGLLWSIGNFFSMISVQYLGQGVGYSVVQSSILGTCPEVVIPNNGQQQLDSNVDGHQLS